MTSSDMLGKQEAVLSRQIRDQCMECSRCIDQCHFLQGIGESPQEIARRNPTCAEAYSCSLCRLCEAVCPLSLPLRNLFLTARKDAVEQESIEINDYSYLFPDQEDKLTDLFREYCGIDYHECNLDQEGETAFFPGCTLLTYSLRLTKGVFKALHDRYPDVTMLSDCCGLPLQQMGLEERYLIFIENLKEKLARLHIKRLITACPNCYYLLRSLLHEMQIELLTIYQALEGKESLNQRLKGSGTLLTVHDSCPDRFEQIFAVQARRALEKKGFKVVEMEHHLKSTICCGSGGQISHFDEEHALWLMDKRWQEAEDSGAEILTGYCLSCVLNFAKEPHKLKTRHVLNLLLDIDENFSGVKAKAAAMFEGAEGAAYMHRIMEGEASRQGKRKGE